MAQQLILPLSGQDPLRFDNFLLGRNAEAVTALQHLAGKPDGTPLYLWGIRSTGKSHLLQALCHDYATRGINAAYLPLNDADALAPQVTEGLDAMDAVCLDDIHHIAGREDWEHALFHLYNRMRDRRKLLLISGRPKPTSLAFRLPDLQSRMAWGLVFQLQPLNDDGKLQVLTARAHRRGFDLPEEVGRYLLKQLPRDMASLCDAIVSLDHASLAQHRRLTIPFVRSVLLMQPLDSRQR